jgi:hypothetical protein
LRNELVEELIWMGGAKGVPNGAFELIRERRSGEMGNQKRQKRGKSQEKGHEVPLGAAKGSEEKEAGGRQARS